MKAPIDRPVALAPKATANSASDLSAVPTVPHLRRPADRPRRPVGFARGNIDADEPLGPLLLAQSTSDPTTVAATPRPGATAPGFDTSPAGIRQRLSDLRQHSAFWIQEPVWSP